MRRALPEEDTCKLALWSLIGFLSAPLAQPLRSSGAGWSAGIPLHPVRAHRRRARAGPRAKRSPPGGRGRGSDSVPGLFRASASNRPRWQILAAVARLLEGSEVHSRGFTDPSEQLRERRSFVATAFIQVDTPVGKLVGEFTLDHLRRLRHAQPLIQESLALPSQIPFQSLKYEVHSASGTEVKRCPSDLDPGRISIRTTREQGLPEPPLSNFACCPHATDEFVSHGPFRKPTSSEATDI